MFTNVGFLVLRRLRGPLIFLVCVYAVAVLGLVLIPGVDDQGQPWHMSFFHAFYFVSFMGSTIGFGEIPYPFTDAQRLWVLLCIYFSVMAWLYAIGRIITLLQDPAFQQAVTSSGFRRGVKRIVEPFYLICGYGDTGALLLEGLIERGIRAVVVDQNRERINVLELAGFTPHVPALRADCTHPQTLIAAGLQNRRCAGVIALTNSDHDNLKVAISSKLLNPDLPAICRSEVHDIQLNMESFGTDVIINPFDSFAEHLAMALHSPSTFVINEWLTSASGTPLREPLFPPKGRYVLCGYGRFGKAVEQFLAFEGVEATIIEADPERTNAPDSAVRGRGTEAKTLNEGGIGQAVGVIAGTDDDVNNLSIIMTAREINPELFTVARQNHQENHAIFQAAQLHLVMQRSDIIARHIIARLTNPLLSEFLKSIEKDDEDWSNVLATRISAVSGDVVPHTWVITASKSSAPALAVRLFRGGAVHLGDLLRDPADREQSLSCLPLLLRRGGKNTLLPNEDTEMVLGDQVLFCGNHRAQRRMRWTVNHASALDTVAGDTLGSPIAMRLRGPSRPAAH